MSNPLLNERAFSQAANKTADQAGWAAPMSAPRDFTEPITDGPISPWGGSGSGSGQTMTANGAMSATLMLSVLLIAAATFGWSQVAEVGVGEPVAFPGIAIAGFIVGLVAALAVVFKPMWAKFLAPVYAIAQGIAVGAISKLFNMQYDGIVLQAVGATLGVFVVMLLLYRTGVIRVTNTFRRVIVGATVGLMVFYLASFVVNIFGPSLIPTGSGSFSILFSVFVAGLAAFNLALDFDFIDQAERAGAPKQMEWFAAFGLLVTIVWLYLEILRLLAKLRER
ncbi:MAG: Bax inhibitor-1/YccA family protein [Ilumatobacteraceae bacterium]